ncbi:histamine H2 receptor-like [Paramacrobiotus metropolitanus]|uniref:histamine H2 receptor-like n=1 Tax=Paramacrobiotus metropolitanus TaxID=2943436 RepID=UPI002445D0C0|nr:histamine H2 receptor-like [Paramacrobiotus metropolitanus]XP_055345619.1 histamine H2 receptor-like [Paramacrobiotus metropolitanus]
MPSNPLIAQSVNTPVDTDTIMNHSNACISPAAAPDAVFSMAAWQWLLTAAPTCAIVLGTIVGNVLLCLAIVHNRQLRNNITNSFCASLAISDLLLGLCVLPLSFAKLLSPEWKFGSVICNLYVATDVFLSTASILNLFVVSIDRYYAISRPLEYSAIITAPTAVALLALTWLLSALIAFVPIYSGWNTADGRLQNSADERQCLFTVDNPYYSVTLGVGTFYIPLLILYVMYAKILKISYAHVQAIRSQTYHPSTAGHAKEATPQHNPRSRSNSHSHVLRQHRATLTLFIIVGAFTACWLPYFTLFTVHPFGIIGTTPLVEEVALWLGYLNSFVNPFVYGMTNREYRAAFSKLLCSWRHTAKHNLATAHYHGHTHTHGQDHGQETDFICM